MQNQTSTPVLSLHRYGSDAIPVISSKEVARLFEKSHREVVSKIWMMPGFTVFGAILPYTQFKIADSATSVVMAERGDGIIMTREGFEALSASYTDELGKQMVYRQFEALDDLLHAMSEIEEVVFRHREKIRNIERFTGARLSLRTDVFHLCEKHIVSNSDKGALWHFMCRLNDALNQGVQPETLIL
jgi:hypothetical protein